MFRAMLLYDLPHVDLTATVNKLCMTASKFRDRRKTGANDEISLRVARFTPITIKKSYFSVTVRNDQLPTLIPDQKWISDTFKWPAIVCPHIYTYLIEKLSVCTTENQRADKSVHVQLCTMWSCARGEVYDAVLRFEVRCSTFHCTTTSCHLCCLDLRCSFLPPGCAHLCYDVAWKLSICFYCFIAFFSSTWPVLASRRNILNQK